MKLFYFYNKLSFLFIAFFLSNSQLLYAQVPDECGTTDLMKSIQDRPELYERFLSQFTSTKVSRGQQNGSTLMYTIPVVVHVVKNNAVMNVQDADIINMINILNTDFAKLNADTTAIPVAFKPLAGSVSIEFCLAQRDPDGFPTNGIVRVNSTHAPFTTSFQSIFEIESSSSGGSDYWGGSRYFNIYITDVVSGIAGFASLGYPPAVIDFTAVGSRTITHEMGHSFDLDHIWGQTSGLISTGHTCADDDGIADTPLQWGPATGIFPVFDSCTTSGNGIMYINHMNYAPVRVMFSVGQAAHMMDTYTLHYIAYGFSNACQPIPPIDAGCSEILSPSASSCTTLQPKILLQNFGTDPLTTATIKYKIDQGVLNTYTWNGLLQIQETDIITLPQLTVTPGSHTLTVYSINPNGASDQDHLNDTSSVAFNSTTPLTMPFTEGFEGTFPPASWAVSNPDNDSTFRLSTPASHSGSGSAIMNNHSLNGGGHIDDISTVTQFTAGAHPLLSFYVAYTYPSNVDLSDTLEILVSTNCGETFSLVYKKSGDSLRTAPRIGSTTFFIPNSTHWRKDSVDLSGFALTSSNAMIVFRNIGGFGNQLYLDDINIQNKPVGIEEVNLKNFYSIYPNPSTTSFTLETSLDLSHQHLEIFNFLGERLFEQTILEKKTLVNLNQFVPGLYFVKVLTENGSAVKKLIVQ